jgi:hypothetical protein
VGRETGGRKGEVIDMGCAASLKMLWSFVCLVSVVHVFHVDSLIYRLGVAVGKHLATEWDSIDQTVSLKHSGAPKWWR